MKKKIFLVGALVAMSMSAMFVACSKDDKNAPTTPTNGCTCTFRYDGETETDSLPFEEIKQIYDVSTCEAFASRYQSEARANGMDMSVSCTAY